MENNEDKKLEAIRDLIKLVEIIWRENVKEIAKLNERVSTLEGKDSLAELEKSLADIAETLRRKS